MESLGPLAFKKRETSATERNGMMLKSWRAGSNAN
jgi:hypothetical protein